MGYIREPGYDYPDGASIIDPDGKGPAISWLRLPEVKAAKNRVHIDIRVAGEGPTDAVEQDRLIRAKMPELVALGASVVGESTLRRSARWRCDARSRGQRVLRRVTPHSRPE